ncbi:hypothetical protein GCM10010381_66940 [Streptomyces xantholiticus]|nr:hypothetical protein GCM10010381_66940 [Streptomyces xantholiticus]
MPRASGTSKDIHPHDVRPQITYFPFTLGPHHRRPAGGIPDDLQKANTVCAQPRPHWNAGGLR